MERASELAGCEEVGCGEVCGGTGSEEIAPEASIWRTVTGGLVAIEGAGAAIRAGCEGVETGREAGGNVDFGVFDFDVKTGEGPGGLASERGEREPDKRRALEAKVQTETLRWRRDALSGEKRCVQFARDAFFAAEREFGAGVCTMKSPLIFEGAAQIFEVTCEKTAPKLQKRQWLESRS